MTHSADMHLSNDSIAQTSTRFRGHTRRCGRAPCHVSETRISFGRCWSLKCKVPPAGPRGMKSNFWILYFAYSRFLSMTTFLVGMDPFWTCSCLR